MFPLPDILKLDFGHLYLFIVIPGIFAVNTLNGIWKIIVALNQD